MSTLEYFIVGAVVAMLWFAVDIFIDGNVAKVQEELNA
jgi:hypothetical protein